MQKQTGFTLIETILYLAITGIIITGLVLFGVTISNSRAKNYVAQEVQANGRVALDLISQKIRAANGVNVGASVFNTDPGILSLSMADGGKNPTIIDLTANDGILRIKEGASAAVSITSNEVKITNLVFTDLSSTSARENVRVNLTIDFDDGGSGDVRYIFSKSWQKAVSLRQ